MYGLCKKAVSNSNYIAGLAKLNEYETTYNSFEKSESRRHRRDGTDIQVSSGCFVVNQFLKQIFFPGSPILGAEEPHASRSLVTSLT